MGPATGRDPQSSGADAPRRAAPAVAEARCACPARSSARGVGSNARGAAARRTRGSGAPRRTQLGRPAPVRLQGAGPAAESGRGGGAGLGQRPAAERRVGVGWRALLPERGRLTIDPGQRAAARASGRRVGAVPYPGAQREEKERGRLLNPRRSRPAEQARRTLGPPRAPDARGPLCAGRAPGPAMRAARRSDRRRRPRRGESARRARCQSTINAGPRPVARNPLACRSASAH